MGLLLLVILIVLLLGGWGYRNEYGYGPPGLLTVLLVVLVVLLLAGHVPWGWGW